MLLDLQDVEYKKFHAKLMHTVDEKQGEDRYKILVDTLTASNGVLSVAGGMDLLNAVSIKGTEPDEEGRVYSTQWSSVYDLNNATLILCADRDYKNSYTYTVE